MQQVQWNSTFLALNSSFAPIDLSVVYSLDLDFSEIGRTFDRGESYRERWTI